MYILTFIREEVKSNTVTTPVGNSKLEVLALRVTLIDLTHHRKAVTGSKCFTFFLLLTTESISISNQA